MTAQVNVTVKGGAALTRTMAAATAALPELPTEAGARVIAAASQSTAPRRTGRLAGSVRAQAGRHGAGTITSPVVYAVPIHWGRPAHGIEPHPFVTQAAAHTEPQWTRALEPAAQRLCDNVRGA